MILPSKHLGPNRALLGIGAEILAQLDEDRTGSELWVRVQEARGKAGGPLSFDWFVLSLSFLYAIAAVDQRGGVITVTPPA